MSVIRLAGYSQPRASDCRIRELYHHPEIARHRVFDWSSTHPVERGRNYGWAGIFWKTCETNPYGFTRLVRTANRIPQSCVRGSV